MSFPMIVGQASRLPSEPLKFCSRWRARRAGETPALLAEILQPLRWSQSVS